MKIYDKMLDEDLSFENLGTSKFGAFKRAWKKNLINLVLLNLLAIIGGGFALYFLLARSSYVTFLGEKLPFSGNTGVGYPLSVGLDKTASSDIIAYDSQFFLILIPCIILFGVFLAGCFNVIKNWIYGKNIMLFRTFFKGAKQNAFTFAVISALIAGVLWLCNFLLSEIALARLNGAGGFGYILLIILIWIFGIYCFISCAFMMCYVTTYKTYNIFDIIAKGFVFTARFAHKNLLFGAIAFGPIALFSIGGISQVVAILYLFIGISYTILSFFTYSQHVFESMSGNIKQHSYSEQVKDDQNNVVESTSSDITETSPGSAPKQNTPVQHSNKKKHNSKKRKR